MIYIDNRCYLESGHKLRLDKSFPKTKESTGATYVESRPQFITQEMVTERAELYDVADSSTSQVLF